MLTAEIVVREGWLAEEIIWERALVDSLQVQESSFDCVLPEGKKSHRLHTLRQQY